MRKHKQRNLANSSVIGARASAVAMALSLLALAGCQVKAIGTKAQSDDPTATNSSPVPSSNQAPTLTSVSTLATATEDTAFTISYSDLASAADEADGDGDPISFRIEAVSSGTLTKGGSAVSAGSTTVASGESVVWTPAANANGSLNAFTIRAYDGIDVSASAIPVVVTTSAVNDVPTLSSISTLTGATEDTAFTISYATLAGAANESDVDGDAISFRVEAVSSGTLTKGGSAVTAGTTLLSSGEDLVWTPAADATGNLNAFTLRAYDGSVASASAIQVVVTVTAANDPPTLTTISNLTGATEDTAFTISYATLAGAANESDVDGDAISFRVEAVSSGTLTKGGSAVTPGTTLLASGESLVWTPAANANGSLNAFTVRAYDGALSSSSAIQVVINTAAVADAPTLSSINTLSGAVEDTAFTISYADLASVSNESDVDGDAISFRVDAVSTGTLTKGGSAVTAGSTLLSAGESLVWTPAANATGTLNAFTVKAWDGGLASSSAIQVQVSVGSDNDPPTLTTISNLTGATEDTLFTISYATLAAAANEADLDGDAISFRIEAVSTGTLIKGGSAVTPGTTTLASGESLSWTPDANANGNLNAFTVKAYDGSSASATAIQVVVVTAAVADAPTLSTISTLTGASEDAAFTISYADLAAAANEADADGGAISFRVEAVSTGTLTKGGSAVTAGTTLLSSGESLVWTPVANANGTLNAFTVKAWDGGLASSSAVQVQVTVGASNDAPTLTTIANLTGATEDTLFSISYADLAAAADEADAESDPISFRIEAVSTGTLIKGGSAVTPGTTLLSSGETLSWTPAANANGNLNAFTIRAHDGTSASATAIQVVVVTAAVADAPTLSTINTLAGDDENTPVTISYADLATAANEADADGDALSFRIEAVSTGTLTKGGSAVTAGSTLLSTGESVVWTPAFNANGNLNAFTVKAYDGALASSTAVQVVINVGATNSPPTLTTVATLTGATEDTAFTISYATLAAAANEADPESDPISFRVESVTTGNLTKGGSAVTDGVTLLSSGENWVWTPANNANGTLNAFTIRAYDGTLASSTAIQVVVSVGAVNDSPTLSTISTLATATEDTAFTISYATLLGASNANDTEGDSISFRIEAVSTGTLTKGGSAVTAGTTQLSSGESLVWTPAANANGSLNAFTVKAHDGNSASASAVQVVVTTTAVNDIPTLSSISTLTGASEETAFTISYADLAAAANEADADGDAISFRVEAVSTGILTKGGSAVTAGSTLLSSGESLVWTPAANATGNLNAFTVKAYDGTAPSSSATQVVVSVSNTNDAPTLSTISTLATATEDTAFTISYAALAGAADEADADGDAISFRIEAVSTGTLTKGGSAVTAGSTTIASGESVVWTPASNANGALNAFTVRAYDGTALSTSTVQVVVTTNAVNDAPTLSTISTLATATEDTAFTISYATLAGAANEADVDGDALSFRVEAVSTGTLTKGGSAVTPGTTTIASGESLVWTPASNANGTLNAFTVKAYDGTAESSTAIQVAVTVTSVNDAPTLTTISTLATATEDTAFTISYTTLSGAANEADVDGDALSFRIEAVSSGTLTKGGSAVTPGTTTIASGESLVWTPDANANGTLNAFTVVAHDGALPSSSAIQVQVTTSAVNDPPTISSIADQSANFETATSAIAFTVGDTETAAGSLTLSGTSSNTTLVPNANIVFGGSGANRTVTVTPAAGQSGIATITVTVSDGSLTASDTFELVVVPRMDLESSVEMVAQWLRSTTSSFTYERTKSFMDTTDYDGTISYFFEINALNSHASNSYAVDLLNSTGSAIATINVPAMGSSGVDYRRIRSTAFTPTSGLSHYRVRLAATAVANQLEVTSARILVQQTGATKTRLYFPLSSYRATAAEDFTDGASVDYVTTTTYSQGWPESHSLFQKDESAYSRIASGSSWRLDAVLSSSNAAGTASVALFNQTANAMVSGSEISTTGSDSFYVDFSNSATNFTDLQNFEPRLKISNAAYKSRLYKANLSVKLDNLTKGRIFNVVRKGYENTSTPGQWSSERVLTDLSRFSNPTQFFESTAWVASAGNGSIQLESTGTSDSSTTSTLVPGSLITPTTTRARIRTGALPIVSGDRHVAKINWTAGTVTTANAFLITDIGYDTNATNVTPTLTQINPLTGGVQDVAYTIPYATLAAAANEFDADGDAIAFRVEAVSTGTLTKGGSAVTVGTTLLSSGESLVWTPASGAFGNLNAFTVKAYDGSLASASAVQVVVTTASNTAPTISAIADQITNFGTATSAIAFTVGDAESTAGSLTLSGISSNTTLVPNANIVFGGSGASRTVTVTPAAGQSGTANITVTVSDGYLTASDTFVLTVIPRIDLEVPIEMVNRGALSRTSAYIYTRSKTHLDTTDFDGTVTYYWELIATNTGGSSATVDLLNASGTVLTSISVPSGTTTPARIRSAAFTPTAGLSYYRMRTPATTAQGDLTVYTSRLIVQQVGATKTRLYFALGSNRTDAPTINDGTVGGNFAHTNSTTYDWGLSPLNFTLFQKDESAYKTIASGNPWRFEVSLASTNAAATASGALFNKTTGALVSGSELTTTTADTYYVDLPNGAVNFTDLDEFEFRIKTSNASYAAYSQKALLSVKLTNLSKGRQFYRVRSALEHTGPSQPTLNAADRMLWDASRYSNPEVKFESVAQVTTNGGASLQLESMGTLDSGTTYAGVVPGTAWTPTTTRARNRSEAISLASGDRYHTKLLWSSGTLSYSGSYLVVNFGYDDSASNVAPTLTAVTPLSGATEDTAFTISYATLAAAANEYDADGDALSFRIEAVSSGTLTKGGSAVVAGTTTLASGESLVWTPASNANGTLNAFTIKAYDGTALSSTATQVQVAVASVNDAAPTLTTISTLTGATEDTAFTISYADLAAAADEADVDGDAILFRVEAVSSGTLTKGGSAVTAGTTMITTGESFVWTPAANANGTLAAFTVKAWDGTAASASAVQVNVSTAAVNDPPTIVAIADQVTNFNTATGAITVTIGDVETAAASLTLTKASSNTTLVPTANIVFGGSGTSRTVTITPVTGQSGTANITVTVDDGTTTTSDIFQLTVYPRIDLEVPIEMLGIGVGSSTTARQFTRSKTFLDTNDFDGATSLNYYFEVNGRNAHATISYDVELVNSAGTAVASITLPPAATVGYIRYRSAAFTPTAGLSHYFIKMPATSAANDITVGNARILVHQVGATKTRLYFPLVSLRSYTNADIGTTGAPDYGMLTTYGQSRIEAYSLFHKDDSAYSQIASGTPWRFEVNMATASSPTTMDVALFNHTTNTMVTGSQLSGTNTDDTVYVDLSNSAANFTDMNEFEARYRSSSGSVNAQVFAARLSVKLTSLSKGRIYHRVRNGWSVTADGTQGADGRTLYESNRYVNPTAYFELTGSNSVASGGTVELQTMGVNDTGTAGTYITNSRLTPTTTRSRMRSPALSLTSGDRYTVFWDWVSGTMTAGPAYLIIDFGP